MLATKAQKANIAFSPQQLIGIMGSVTVMAFLGLTIGTEAALPIRVLVAVVMGVGGVFVWVSNKAKKRMTLMDEQLPDAVELMVRSLRVGHPFSSAIGIVAKEIPDPLGTEFGMISDEAAYGRNVAESLKAFAELMAVSYTHLDVYKRQGLPLSENATKNPLRKEIQKLAKSLFDLNKAAETGKS